MDNTGPYITYDELIVELFLADSTLVTSADTTLSVKTPDPAGDVFTFAGGSPVVGDVIFQAGESAFIIEFPTGSTIKLSKAEALNPIVNGPAKVLHSEKIPKAKGESIIQTAMDFFDLKTGQFFNKRTGVFEIEGNNSSTMLFGVPIIEVTKLLINGTDIELIEGADEDFFAFKGRLKPADNRRNPRIKLNIAEGTDDLFRRAFFGREFQRGTITEITGSFGFLEPDGSTPTNVKKAILMLASIEINTPVTSSIVGGGAGPLKRVRVDLHEKEFFEIKSATTAGSRSGNPEVDRIIMEYKRPMGIGGSFKRSENTDRVTRMIG